MKRTIVLLIVAILVGFLFAVIGCNLEVGSVPDTGGPTVTDGDSGDPISETQHTGAAVSVPTISSGLLSALDAVYAPGSGELSAQAILFATEVTLGLYQNDTHVRDWHLTETNTIQDDSPPMFTTFLEMDAGEGYRLEAEVYNNKVSSEIPVVTGLSDIFAVNAGVSTEVIITAIPFAPEVFSDLDGGPATLSIAQTPYYFDENSWIVLTDMGGEKWVQLDLTTGVDKYARLVADPSDNADVIMLVYDDDGSMSEGVNDPPPGSWGLLPTDLGGTGGTRAGLMGPLEDTEPNFTKYIGLTLLNRTGETTNSGVEVTMDILERPAPAEPYSNAVVASDEPDFAQFYSLPVGEEATQTVFHSDGGGPMVHWFELQGINWAEVSEPFDVTVTANFDVLDASHIAGVTSFYDGVDWIEFPVLALMAGNTAAESPPPAVYAPLDDAGYLVTILEDGSTQIEFTVSVNPTNPVEGGDPVEVDLAGLAISSRFPGNEFTVSWNASGAVDLIID